MKPDWKEAPEWAQWLAMDEDGRWFWHENKPTLCFGRHGMEEWDSDGRILCVSDSIDWTGTLCERP